ncbi:hypothetical protein FACS1894142_0210 [Spirochaetia bacterium]|nr:hypothetical protein FACS1894142_0210 [Spirochaetia bacterium]
MRKVRKTAAIFLLLLGGVIVSAQQQPVFIAQAMEDAGTFLGAHLAPETMTALLNITTPTPELSKFVTDKFIAGMMAMGVGSVVQLDGDLIDTDATNISQVLGIETIVIGRFTYRENRNRLELRTINGKTGAALGTYTASIQMDSVLMALLDPAASIVSTVRVDQISAKEAELAAREAEVAAKEAEIAAKETKEAAKAAVNTDFSPGRRVAGVLLNPLLGLGSYTMGDWGGGLTMTLGYGIAASLILWDLDYIPLYQLTGIPRTAPLFGETGTTFDKFGIPGTVGLGIAAATVVFGILRPIFYHRPGSTKVAAALNGAHIAILPDVSGIKAVRLSYRFQF